MPFILAVFLHVLCDGFEWSLCSPLLFTLPFIFGSDTFFPPAYSETSMNFLSLYVLYSCHWNWALGNSYTIIWIFIHEEPIILNWLHYMPSKFHFRCMSVMNILLFEERIKFNSENLEDFFWICDNELWNLRNDLIINWSKIMGKKVEDLEIFLFEMI